MGADYRLQAFIMIRHIHAGSRFSLALSLNICINLLKAKDERRVLSSKNVEIDVRSNKNG